MYTYSYVCICIQYIFFDLIHGYHPCRISVSAPGASAWKDLEHLKIGLKYTAEDIL